MDALFLILDSYAMSLTSFLNLQSSSHTELYLPKLIQNCIFVDNKLTWNHRQTLGRYQVIRNDHARAGNLWVCVDFARLSETVFFLPYQTSSSRDLLATSETDRQFSNLALCIRSQGVLSSSYIINDIVVWPLTEQEELVCNEPCKRVNDFASIHLKGTSTIKDVSNQGEEKRGNPDRLKKHLLSCSPKRLRDFEKQQQWLQLPQVLMIDMLVTCCELECQCGMRGTVEGMSVAIKQYGVISVSRLSRLCTSMTCMLLPGHKRNGQNGSNVETDQLDPNGSNMYTTVPILLFKQRQSLAQLRP
ncbi:hypothetical protein ABVT39_014945 [Epinephelus coioides]